jgi:hypothetical protein
MTDLPPNFLQLAVAGKRIAFGSGLAEWTAEGAESASVAVGTGLNTCTYFVGIAIAGSAGFVLGVVSVVGATATCRVRSVIGNFAAGTKVAFHWIAIET